VSPAWTTDRDAVGSCRAYNARRWEFEKDVLGIDERAPFVCECGNASCARALNLTMLEYESAHLFDTWCAVAPEHTLCQGDSRIVVMHPHFWVVEPISLEAALAAARRSLQRELAPPARRPVR
jgi:hypothetical protein